MKRCALLILTALLAAACSSRDSLPRTGVTVHRSFTAVGEDSHTRTGIDFSGNLLWNEEDSITVFATDGMGSVFSDVTVSQNGKVARFEGDIPLSSAYVALYPASARARLSNDTLYAWIPVEQKAVTNSFDPAAGLSVAQTLSEDLYFRNVGALLCVVIRNEGIRSVTLSAEGESGACLAGGCAIPLGGEIPVAELEAGHNTVTLTGDFEFDEAYYFSVFPGTYHNLEVIFTDVSGRTATFTNRETLTISRSEMADVIDLTIAATDWKGGSSQPSADYGWPELPAQRDLDRNGVDDLNPDYYYSHTFRADAQSIRNFSSCYSRGMLHPVWVAAPMHSCYKGSSGRNDSYRNDPQIPFDQSPKFTGFTRGHMIGSSDRTVSVATNKQVFFYSNIGAQLQTGFNTGGGAWNNLEEKVDTYWCSDTLYQVVGCIFQTFTDRYGHTEYAARGTNSVGSFQIPTAWYKALLRTKSGQSGKKVADCSADELQCVAFILGHYGNAKHKPSTQDMYSIAELEALTGLNFFVNVPNAPKSSYDKADWGL